MIITLIGRMASGKTTVANRLVDHGYSKIPRLTTRSPRKGEQDGDDYIFLSEADFDERQNKGLLAEHHEYYTETGVKKYGGMVADYLLDLDRVVVCDNFAVKQLVANGYRSRLFIVWLDPPEDIVMRRALARGDDVNEVARRCIAESFEYQEVAVKQLYDLHIAEDKPIEYIVQDILDAVENYKLFERGLN